MSARAITAAGCLFALGCQATPLPGDACARSADCPASLVCAIGRCREACATSLDCPSLARCLVEPSSGAHVCSLDVDSCRTHACAVGFVCRDDQCVNACGSLVECPDGSCVDGACVPRAATDAGVPPNDAAPTDAGTDASSDAAPMPVTTCPGATLIVPTGMETDVPYDPTGLTSSAGGCDPDSPDAYYVVRLTQRSIVAAWLDALHGGALGWVSDCSGNRPPACEWYCGTFIETGAVLEAGDHVLVLDDVDATTLHVLVFPIGDDVVAEQVAPPAPTFDLDATLSAGTGLSACGATGPTHVFWYYQCGLGPSRVLDVSTCGSAANVDLSLLDDGTGGVLACGADDTACATGGLTATHDLLEGPTVVLIAVSGHTPADVGAVHVHGNLH